MVGRAPAVKANFQIAANFAAPVAASCKTLGKTEILQCFG